MTIYTLGDPELLREALLALATVFGLVEWGDPGNALGLGGNMLAVALIGLMAIGIAGITSQQVRVDYLLVALIVFGVAFSSDVDVNVEDIQTGDSNVVADVPVGIAMVASAASSAARSLTEITSLALQRPGIETSILAEGGFLDPLKVLYNLRDIRFEELDEYVNRSMLEFYRSCIGNTLATDPTIFSINDFRTSPDPLSYVLNEGRYINFNTMYYTEADPAGTVLTCDGAAGFLYGRINDLTIGSDEALAKLRLKQGSKYYNTPFEFADLENYADMVSRGVFSGQDYMKAALMRNFINVAEAWRLSEYGTSEAQYVATVTDALEQKRVNDTAAGTIALQYMFPLMTFFQFLFFSLAPFVALIIMASPFTAGKSLGSYMLFGVWAYAWMPVAAIINHYIQISIGNTLEFADIGAVGLQYTAIRGMDSLWDQLANKIAIGSLALASTPIIVGAVLTASLSGLTSLAGKLGSAGSINTSVSSPSAASGRPLVQAGGIGNFAIGTVPNSGGALLAPSINQRNAFGSAGVQKSISSGLSEARSMSQQASNQLESSRSFMAEKFDSVMQSGVRTNANSSGISATLDGQFKQALGKVIGTSEVESLNSQQRREVSSKFGISLPVFGVGNTSANSVGNADLFNRIQNNETAIKAELGARLAESSEAKALGATSDGGSLVRGAKDYRKSEEEFERTSQATARAERSSQVVNNITQGGSRELVDLVTERASNHPNYKNMFSELQGMTQPILGMQGMKEVSNEAYGRWMQPDGTGIIGADGRRDGLMDTQDKIGSWVLALADRANMGDEKAFEALAATYSYLGLKTAGSMAHGTSNLGDAGRAVDGIGEVFAGVEVETGEQGSALRPPEGFEQVVSDAATARASAADEPTIRESDRAAVQERNTANIEQAKEGGVGEFLGDKNIGTGLAPNSAFYDGLFDKNSVASRKLPDLAVDLWSGESGIEGGLKSTLPPVLSAESQEERTAAIDRGLGALTTQVRTQLGTEANGYDARKSFNNYVENGFEPTDAFVATYAELGVRTPGFGDLAAGAIGGAVGLEIDKAGDRLAKKGARRGATRGTAARVGARAGGLVVGVVGGVMAAGLMYRSGQANKEEMTAFVRDRMSERFREKYPESAEEFDRRAASATDTEDLASIMVDFMENDSNFTLESLPEFVGLGQQGSSRSGKNGRNGRKAGRRREE